MPVPIIARQRALSRAGEIRIGAEKPERGAGRKLETFRLTSQHHDIIETCASLYGGKPSAWKSPSGDAWQLYTTASALPVLLIAGYSLQQIYERWEGATKCTRRCDGEDEQISGGPCVCNANGLEGKDACDIITRLMVVLPETGTSLGWMLRSTGENAARELSGAIMVADELARGRAFVPATLRLTQRRSTIDGQVVKYAVPVLDFNMLAQAAARQLDVPATVGELEQTTGYTPAPPRQIESGVTVGEGIAAAEAEATPKARRGRQAAPIPVVDDIEFGGPVPIEGEPSPIEAEPAKPVVQPPANVGEKVTAAQAKKLNVLVGKLRDAGAIETVHLWKALAKSRSYDVDQMVELLDGRDGDGELHWAPLRDSLSKVEATDLIDRLAAKLEEPVAA